MGLSTAVGTAVMVIALAVLLTGAQRMSNGSGQRSQNALSPASLSARLRASASAEQAQRFAVVPERGSLRAGTPGITSVFAGAGVSMRVASGTVHLTLAVVGRAGRLEPVARALPTGSGNSVFYRRGSLVEWYRNGPVGLEQVFSLKRRPQGGPGWVILAMSSSGSLTPRRGADSVEFATPSGGVGLRYGALRATDAAGRRLAAALDLRAGKLVLRVDDRSARYPLTVDPLIQPGAAAPPKRTSLMCTDHWKVAVSGSWGDASKWDNGVPNSTDTACIDVAGSYVVTLTGSATVSHLGLGGASGTQTLAIAGTCNGGGSLQTGAGSVGGNGTIVLTSVGTVGCSPWSGTLSISSGVLTNAGSLISDPGDNATTRTIVGSVQNGIPGNGGGQLGSILVSQPLSVQGSLTNAVGTVAVAPGQQLNVSINFSQSATATLAPQISSASSLGTVHASGTATLDGAVSLTGTYPAVLPQSLGILSADGGVTRTFASADAVVSLSSGTYYLPSYSSGTVSLRLLQGTLSLSAGSGYPGSSITVSGTNWAPSDTITIGFADEAAATTTTPRVSTDGTGTFSTPIRIPANASPGTGRFWVASRFTGASGNRMSSQPFTVNSPPPSVSRVSPSSGPLAGGATVMITGANLTGATAVSFGGTAGTGVAVISDTKISAISPSGSGTVDVTVTTPGGTSATSAGAKYSYVPAPTITNVSPSSGPTSGGTSVTITGANLTGATAVSFGGAAGTGVMVVSGTRITATSPSGSGTVDATVATPGGTSATNAGDKYTYTSPPLALTDPPSPKGSTAAGFVGSANPNGLTTTAEFVYGLDASYRGSGFSGSIYDQSTPVQVVGSDFSSHPVVASVSNLIPDALYRVRLVAFNGAGSAVGPDQTFMTAKAPAPPSPVLGKTDLTPVGVVYVLQNGKFVRLTQTRQVPSGTEIDALHGSVNVLAALGTKGKTDTGTFGGAVFKVTQARSGPDKGLTTLTLVEGALGAPSYVGCKAKGAADGTAQAARLSSRILQTLRSRSRGRFRTRGRYAAGTVRGTQWTTTDRCDGTLIAVQVHTVLVTDLVKHITIALHAGHSYLANAPKHGG